jgi:hypothetical protein
MRSYWIMYFLYIILPVSWTSGSSAFKSVNQNVYNVCWIRMLMLYSVIVVFRVHQSDLCMICHKFGTLVCEHLLVRGYEVGRCCGTALQTGRSRVRFPTVSLVFFIDIILPVALWPWGRLSLLCTWVPGVFSGGKNSRYIGMTTLTPSCVDCLKIWEHRPPGNLRAFQGLYWLYRRLDGPPVQSTHIRIIAPTSGYDPQTVHLVSSRHSDWATGTTLMPNGIPKWKT